MKSRSRGSDRYNSPFKRDLRIRPVVHSGQVPPLGAPDARAFELLQAVERDPVFVDPKRRLQVIPGARHARATCRAPTPSEGGTCANLELRFEPDDVVLGELFVRSARHGRDKHPPPHRGAAMPRRWKANLPARAPRFAVAAVGPAVAFEVVVGDVELIADAEL